MDEIADLPADVALARREAIDVRVDPRILHVRHAS